MRQFRGSGHERWGTGRKRLGSEGTVLGCGRKSLRSIVSFYILGVNFYIMEVGKLTGGYYANKKN